MPSLRKLSKKRSKKAGLPSGTRAADTECRSEDISNKTGNDFLHNAVWPLREVVNGQGKHESTLISEPTVQYLRDVYDHVIHIIDSVDIYREMLSSML